MASALEQHFELLLMANKLNKHFKREYRFHPTREWRFDFANTDTMTAIEIEGGAWSNGRHTRGSGFVKDAEKYNEAVKLGWRVLRYTSKKQMQNFTDDYKAILCQKLSDAF